MSYDFASLNVLRDNDQSCVAAGSLSNPHQVHMHQMYVSHLIRVSLLKFRANYDVMRSHGLQRFGKNLNSYSMFLLICVFVKSKWIHCLLAAENLWTDY